jgi:hypothetical protein
VNGGCGKWEEEACPCRTERLDTGGGVGTMLPRLTLADVDPPSSPRRQAGDNNNLCGEEVCEDNFSLLLCSMDSRDRESCSLGTKSAGTRNGAPEALT